MKANIALTTVIIISAVLLLSGLTLTVVSIDVTSATASYNDITLAKLSSLSCLEESLYNLTINRDYTGTVQIDNTFQTYGCTSITSVSPVDANYRVIEVTGTVDQSTFNEFFYVDITQIPFEVIR